MSPLLPRLCLGLALLASVPALAEPSVTPSVRRWIAGVVTRIGEAERAAPVPRGGAPRGTAEIRLRIAADGSLRAADLARSSGSEALDARLLAAARGAGPFGAPPPALLTEDGTTELSFPVRATGAR